MPEIVQLDFEEEMRKTNIVIICKLLDSFFKCPEKSDRWLRCRNPLLGGTRPIDMIRVGRSEKLIKFIKTCLAENKR